jgi:hypothetical protein
MMKKLKTVTITQELNSGSFLFRISCAEIPEVENSKTSDHLQYFEESVITCLHQLLLTN